jgi:hypothetical protein
MHGYYVINLHPYTQVYLLVFLNNFYTFRYLAGERKTYTTRHCIDDGALDALWSVTGSMPSPTFLRQLHEQPSKQQTKVQTGPILNTDMEMRDIHAFHVSSLYLWHKMDEKEVAQNYYEIPYFAFI